jgi:hypothetical protein
VLQSIRDRGQSDTPGKRGSGTPDAPAVTDWIRDARKSLSAAENRVSAVRVQTKAIGHCTVYFCVIPTGDCEAFAARHEKLFAEWIRRQ